MPRASAERFSGGGNGKRLNIAKKTQNNTKFIKRHEIGQNYKNKTGQILAQNSSGLDSLNYITSCRNNTIKPLSTIFVPCMKIEEKFRSPLITGFYKGKLYFNAFYFCKKR